MRLKEEQINRLAEKIFGDLTTLGLIQLRAERGVILNDIKAAISADIKAEEQLEQDAENLLEQNLRAMGSGAAGIDRHKMLKMVKEKLAKERKIVL